MSACSRGPVPGEQYMDFAGDGAWCWFSDPRAIFYRGQRDQTFAGWIDARGNVTIGALDHETGQITTYIIHDTLQVDDHNNPSLLIRPDGRLIAFYSLHSDSAMYMRVSERPEEITSWGPITPILLNDPGAYEEGLTDHYTYTNPYLLSDEKNRIFLFWRGLSNKPNVSYSDDRGATWSRGRILVQPEQTYKDQRPYVKYASNGKNRIHIAFTNGHPRDEPENGIYYVYYSEDAFYRADGSRIASLDSIPFDPFDADIVYDARNQNARAWIWDVAEDSEGHPVIVYTRLPAENDHRYHYARFDGEQWSDTEIVAAGGWFPNTPEGDEEREPHYSGGIVLDHADPSIVYLSRPKDGVFEIERWQTHDGGQTWQSEAVTEGSTRDNVRPFAVRNARQTPRVLWLQNEHYLHYTDYRSAVKMDRLP